MATRRGGSRNRRRLPRPRRPITGGNVSLYNETDGEAIFPTPVLGIVGLLDDASRTVTRLFKSDAASVVLLGESRGELGGSECWQCCTITSPALHRSSIWLIDEPCSSWSCVRSGSRRIGARLCGGWRCGGARECCFDTPFDLSADLPSVQDVPQAFRVNASLFGESSIADLVVSSRAGDELGVAEPGGAG